MDAPRFTRDSSDILVGISPDYFSMLLFISSFFFFSFWDSIRVSLVCLIDHLNLIQSASADAYISDHDSF